MKRLEELYGLDFTVFRYYYPKAISTLKGISEWKNWPKEVRSF